MNRSKKYQKRVTKPDLVYNNVSISRFIGKIMKNGEKLKASNYVYNALKALSEELDKTPVQLFEECVLLLHPQHRLRPWRIASRVYPLPYPIKDPVAANKQAIHWLVRAIRQRKERSLDKKIIAEIKDIFKGTGVALSLVQKRKELAIEYEAYVHYGA